MRASFEDMIDAAMPDWPALDPAQRALVLARCAGIARMQVRRAPCHIRIGLAALIMAFRAYALVASGAERGAIGQAMGRFSALPLPMVAGLERIVRSVTVLAFFEDPMVLAALGEEGPAARQAEFRALRARLDGFAP